MDIKGIVTDSTRYPLSDWKKLLIFGIILLFSSIYGTEIIAMLVGTTNIVMISFLVIIGLILGLFRGGYSFKIIKSSLNNAAKPPEFNSWANMFRNGIKILIIDIVYNSPVILIILIFTVIFPSTLGIIGSHPTIFLHNIYGIMTRIFSNLRIAEIWILITTLYLIIIYPILLVAITNMAHNDSKLSSAFKFSEIFNKISNIGLGNLITWYIMLGLIYLAVNFIGIIILTIFGFLTIYIIGLLLISLIASYFYMYVFRSAALLYMSDENP